MSLTELPNPTKRPWRDVPKGRYAIPLEAVWLDETDPDWCVEFANIICIRTVPQHLKTGKTRGRDQLFVEVWSAEGVTREQFHLYADQFKEFYGYSPTDRDKAVEFILDEPAMYQSVYGQLTSRCALCGRKLTDPQSQRRGIGPECYRG